MSDESVTVDDDLEIDLAWKSDLMSVYNDEDGETVDVPGDSNTGDVVTETHPDIDGWDELTDTQQEIIKTAANPAKEWASLTELADELSKAHSDVSRTLRNHAPELHETVKNDIAGDPNTFGASFTDEIRLRLLNGESTTDIEKTVDASGRTIRRHARKEMNADATTQPPLQYDSDFAGNGWKMASGSTEQANLPQTEDTAETTHPQPRLKLKRIQGINQTMLIQQTQTRV
jgi:hypothetical protein